MQVAHTLHGGVGGSLRHFYLGGAVLAALEYSAVAFLMLLHTGAGVRQAVLLHPLCSYGLLFACLSRRARARS